MNDIEKLIDLYYREVLTSGQAFFAWKHLNSIPATDREALRALNRNALTWNIVLLSLQNTFFITIGRLFDTNGEAFSAHALLNACIENIDQFSKTALSDRKKKNANHEVETWLPKYLTEAYEPIKKDFQRLKGPLSTAQKQYESVYRPIRHKFIAHREMESIDKAHELFSKTNIGEVEGLINSLYQIHGVVWNLLHNGQKSNLADYRFSEEERVHIDVAAMLNHLKKVDNV